MTDDVVRPSATRAGLGKKVQLIEDVVALVAERCDAETVQALRLVSKAASFGAAKIMFKNLKFQINAQGCEQLVAVAVSRYANFVRQLSIRAPDDDEGLSPDEPPMNFVTNYFRNIEEPSIVVLGAIMSLFSRLDTLTVHLNSNLEGTTGNTGPLTGKAMLAIMYGVSSANLQTLTKLRLQLEPDYDATGSSEIWSSVNNFNDGHLSRFKDVEIYAPYASNLFQDGIPITGLLNAFHSLERLEIPENNMVWMTLQSSNTPFKFWLPKLKSLVLSCLSTTGNGLISVLEGCQSTLTNFSISTTELSSIHSNVASNLAHEETWEAVFDFLRTKCSELVAFKHQTLAWHDFEEEGDFADTTTEIGRAHV